MNEITVYWFRRDLRLEDNHGLFQALIDARPVLPLFIFDRVILDRLDDPMDPRVTFIYQEIKRLKTELESIGSSLLVETGTPVEVFKEVMNRFHVAAVYANHDYEPYASERDGHVRHFLSDHHVPFFTYKDQVIFEKDEIIKDDGSPYTVFTPYARKWKVTLEAAHTKGFTSENLNKNFLKTAPFILPGLQETGFRKSGLDFPERIPDDSILSDYHRTRDYPSIRGTSRLGIHLRFGTISIRRLVKKAGELNEVFLNELIWREFYMMILWHFPGVVDQSFKPAYDRILWKNDEREFLAWCQGRTGYPFVDAGMRELNLTGFMHNRLRMITASFLSKHLLVDWRWGEAYFAKKLLDYELASNNGGWQWAAGTGCDAAPYFRVFNPDLQAGKFDPDFKYVLQWIPEFTSEKYIPRIIDHRTARIYALSAFKKALEKK